MSDDEWEPDPIEIPIDGTLDLHHFPPREVKSLVKDYLEECRALGILEVRIVHGKGIGTIREMVHSVLRRLEFVESFGQGGMAGGGWGATLITLKPASDGPGAGA
jgi:dsDNA-specific endonuclease/ATPase MutS2